jgi:hypothetical protein
VSAYRSSIDRTITAIETRAEYFRNLIVVVVTLALITTIWAALARNLRPFAGLVLIVPACGFFFVFDAKELWAWRSVLLDAWVRKEIDFGALKEAVNANRKLPPATLSGMLSTLPHAQDLVTEQKVPSSTREAIAAATRTIYAFQSDKVLLKALATAIVSGSVVIAAASGKWQLLLGITILLLLPVAANRLKRKRIDAVRSIISAASEKGDSTSDQYRQLIRSLHWDATSAREKDLGRFLRIE